MARQLGGILNRDFEDAVFVLSVLQQLEPVENEVGAIVLCHTRELAFQVRLAGATASKCFAPALC